MAILSLICLDCGAATPCPGRGGGGGAGRAAADADAVPPEPRPRVAVQPLPERLQAAPTLFGPDRH